MSKYYLINKVNKIIYLQKKTLIISFILLGHFIIGNTALYLKASEKKEIDTISNNYETLNRDQYLIGPGDILKITIFDSEEFSGDYEILVDGFLYLPIIGRVYVSGLSIDLARKKIEKKYSEELLRPTTHIVLIKSRPLKVSIVGEVERPGIYSLTREEITQTEGGPSLKTSGMPTLVDAIQKAGGITQNANLKNITISRLYLDENNERNYKKAKIDLLKLLNDGIQDSNPYLFDGDIISLKKADSITDDIINIAKANLSPSKITVYIVGNVINPGPLTVKANTPLNQAILYAGGREKWKGKKNNVELIRVNRNGTVTNKKFKLNSRNRVSEDKNPALSDGDIIIVNPSLLNSFGTGLAEITSPLSNVITGITLLKLIDSD